MLSRVAQKARRKCSIESKCSLNGREAGQLEPLDMVGKCCKGEKCRYCYFPDFIPCFHSSSARSQTQGYSMSTTCPCKDRPQVTAGAMVPGVTAAPSVEEVRGQDLVAGLVWDLYSHPEDSVTVCCPLQLLPSSLLLEDSTGIYRGQLRFCQGRVIHGVTTGLCPMPCPVSFFHVLVLRLVTRIF